MLSLATIDADAAELGGTAEIVWGNPGDPEKIIRARIAPAPYKPRPRARRPARRHVGAHPTSADVSGRSWAARLMP
jgi:hypothetical protein